MGKGLNGGEVSFTTTLAPITGDDTVTLTSRERLPSLVISNNLLQIRPLHVLSSATLYKHAWSRQIIASRSRRECGSCSEATENSWRACALAQKELFLFFFWHFSFISISRWPLSFLKNFPWTCMWRLNRKDVGTARHIGSRSEMMRLDEVPRPCMNDRYPSAGNGWHYCDLRRKIEALTDCLRLKNAYCCADSMFF